MVRGSVVAVMVAVMVLAVAGQSSVLASPPCYDRACPAIYAPVCGSDGVTYSSSCHFSIAKCRNRRLYIRHEGECAPKPGCPRFCTLQYDPVCGSDGKTYGNACQLGVEATCNNKPGLHIVRNGPCYLAEAKQ